MIVSHEWLKQFVPHTLSVEQVGELLSRHCVTLDGIEKIGAELSPFVVARVVKAGRHPNSDRLWVTKVDDGSGELLDVVCGAPNVVEGTMYPFARTGTRMPAGIVIEKRKIRGEVSNGMLCSARELGLGEEHDGILALETDAAPGTPLLDVIRAADARLDLDVLPNRPDLLCHLGVAREIAALTGVALFDVPAGDMEEGTFDIPESRGEHEVRGAHASVRIEDPASCPRYSALVIEGVRVAPSPEWLRGRIESIGLRSISNVVDATNYVLHAFGQPVHAFDLDRLAGHAIVVRPTRAGETLVTLDGATRNPGENTTVICDAERPVALAGVMGGRDSEVSDDTTRVLLEVAEFEPKFVRKVRRAVGLGTDASYRFERGIDAVAVPHVARVAAALIVQVAGGTIREQLTVGAEPVERAPVLLRPSRLAKLLGVAVATAEIRTRLESLGCVVTVLDDDAMHVKAPSWRHDLLLEVDLIEEVARLQGFDALPNELRAFRPARVPDDPLHVKSVNVRSALVAFGFLEARPMPFTSSGSDGTPRVRNPLAEDEPFLRASILDTLAGRVEYNLSRMQGNIRLFEIGHVFTASGGRLPLEELRVGVVMTGQRRPSHFTEPRPPLYDRWDAKAIAVDVAQSAYPGSQVELKEAQDALWEIAVDGGIRGSVKQLDVDLPEWAASVFGVELMLGVVSSDDVAAPGSHAPVGAARSPDSAPVRYKPLPSTPAAEFDLALVVPDTVSAAKVEAALRTAAGDLLERVQLFDEFRGGNLAEGTRSLAWRLTLRHPERTLRDKEIEGRRAKMVDYLQKELGIKTRAS